MQIQSLLCDSFYVLRLMVINANDVYAYGAAILHFIIFFHIKSNILAIKMLISTFQQKICHCFSFFVSFILDASNSQILKCMNIANEVLNSE